MFENTIKDKSYGMIGAYRVSGDGQLFKSDVLTPNHIELVIKTAQLRRELNTDWVMGDKTLITVKLTPMQWAEMISCMNVGDGVPCTIDYTEKDGHIPYKPLESKISIIQEEQEKKVDDSLETLKQTIDSINQLLNENKMNKTAGKEILNSLRNVLYKLGDGKFYKDQAREEIEDMIVQAKSVVSNFVDHKIYSTGISALKSGFVEPTLVLEEN